MTTKKIVFIVLGAIIVLTAIYYGVKAYNKSKTDAASGTIPPAKKTIPTEVKEGTPAGTAGAGNQ